MSPIDNFKIACLRRLTGYVEPENMRAVVSAELMRFYPIVRETGHKHARHCVTYTEILIHAAEKRRVYDNQASAPPPQRKPASENRWPRQEQQPSYDPFAGFHVCIP